MSPIDENRKFISVNIAILTISDSRILEEDKSGNFLVQSVTDLGHCMCN